MRLGIVFVEEMRVVGADDFHAVFPCQLDEDGVDSLLHFVGLAVGFLRRILHFVALQLDVVVVAPYIMEPLDCFFGSGQIAPVYLLGHFSADAGRADDEAFVVLLQVAVVGAGTHVEAIDPRTRDELDEIVVAREVLGKHDEVPARLVLLPLVHVFVAATRYVHLAAEDGLEGFLPFLLPFAVDGVADVVELFDAEHVAVVGESHAAHAVGYGLVHHLLDGGLTVEQRVLRVNVEVYEVV